MPIEAVAFDIDGTLYPNRSMYLRSIPFALTHLRLVRAYSRIRKHVRKRRPVTDLQSLERRLLAHEMGIGEAEAAHMIDVAIHERWEAVLNGVRPYPHVRTAIERMKAGGLQMGVSSDFPVDRKLKRLGLDGLFECSLWSEESGYLKPHPEPFRALAECIGLEPSSILYVGNSYEYDVIGAKAVGMRAAHLRRRPVRNSVADVTFRDFRRLAEWVEETNRAENPS
ncbi:MAG: HAD family hydrolase [Spirochaetales bacterium]|nr:HAD family hydrolase [Spirochaetales bacterium]